MSCNMLKELIAYNRKVLNDKDGCVYDVVKSQSKINVLKSYNMCKAKYYAYRLV